MNLRTSDMTSKTVALTAATALPALMAPACPSGDPADDSVKGEFIQKPRYSG